MTTIYFAAVPPHRDQPYTLGYASDRRSFFIVARRALETADGYGSRGRVWAERGFGEKRFDVEELRAAVSAADAVGEHLVDLGWFFGPEYVHASAGHVRRPIGRG